MIESMIEKAEREIHAPDDIIDDDGFRVCPVCGERKERDMVVKPTGNVRRFPTPCRCIRERWQQEEDELRKQQFQLHMEALRRDGVTDPAYLTHTFAGDDGQQPEASQVLQRYAEHFDSMKESNTGVLLTGTVGTGKTYLACATANAVIDSLHPAAVTSLPRLMHLVMAAQHDDRQSVIDRLSRYDLLVIDDLGVERSTEYAVEQVYAVIDSRYRSGKPVIITSNLTATEIKNAQDLQHRRIYDRVLEMCPIRIALAGESRREQIAAQKRKDALRELGYKE